MQKRKRQAETREMRLHLSKRERDIVVAMATGAPNKLIADRLGISEQTVKNRLSALYRRLAVGNRVELLMLVMRKGAIA